MSKGSFEQMMNQTYQVQHVDKNANNEKDTYTTLFSAVNALGSNTVVKMNGGVYQERVQFKKGNFKVQANQLTANVILINDEFPNLVVDLPSSSDKIYLESLKIANVCEVHSAHAYENGSRENLKKQNYRGFRAGMDLNCCLYIKRGIVQMDECKVSLAAYQNEESIVPGIVVEQHGCLIMNRSEVRGGKGTIGVVCKGGQLLIKESVIKDHHVGIGIMIVGKQPTKLIMKNSSILGCWDGLVMNGPFEAIVDNNIFEDCATAGIVIHACNTSKVSNNEIKSCTNGISVYNSFPSIIKNNISDNQNFGVECGSVNNGTCRCGIKFNRIVNNCMGGVYCSGVNNHTCIHSNELLSNGKYGIKIEHQGEPHVFMNKIKKTLGNGVHVCMGSNVFLEKNQIVGSLRCNVVLEGPKNINNYVFGNTISNARGDGLFLLNAENFTLSQNNIHHNNNGILAATGVFSIVDNHIHHNEKNGLLLVDDNYVCIRDNCFQSNTEAGLVIRNCTRGTIQNNTFSQNKAEIVMENDHPSLEMIEEENMFTSEDYDIRVPKNYSCRLI